MMFFWTLKRLHNRAMVLVSELYDICDIMQSSTEQRPHKVSFYVQKGQAEEVMKSLSERLVKRGVRLSLLENGRC